MLVIESDSFHGTRDDFHGGVLCVETDDCIYFESPPCYSAEMEYHPRRQRGLDSRMASQRKRKTE